MLPLHAKSLHENEYLFFIKREQKRPRSTRSTDDISQVHRLIAPLLHDTVSDVGNVAYSKLESARP